MIFFTAYSLRIKCDLFFRLFTVTSLILAVIFFFNLPCFSHSCSFPVWSQWDRMPNNMAKIADARKTVEQLKLEVNIERMMVSRCGGMVGSDHALQQEGRVFRFSWSTAPPEVTTEKSFWSEWNPLTTEPLVLVLVPSLFHTCRFPKQRPTSWPTVKLTPKTTHWWRPSSTQRTRFERRNYFVWFCDFNKHQKNKQKQPVNTFVVVVF